MKIVAPDLVAMLGNLGVHSIGIDGTEDESTIMLVMHPTDIWGYCLIDVLTYILTKLGKDWMS